MAPASEPSSPMTAPSVTTRGLSADSGQPNTRIVVSSATWWDGSGWQSEVRSASTAIRP